MGAKRIDIQKLIGTKINHWTIEDVKYFKDKNNKNRLNVKCKCDCEKQTEKWVRYDIVKSGQSQSCGCVHTEIIKQIGKSKKANNVYDMSNGYGIGYTQNNKVFYFDLEDYVKIKDYYWTIDKDGYAVTILKNENGDYVKRILMHRLLLQLPDFDNETIVDHINRIRYDNRKHNIRIADYSINAHNQNIRKDNKTGKKGVQKHSICGYEALFKYRGKVLTKHFKTFEEAVTQRRLWEKEYFGYYFDN